MTQLSFCRYEWPHSILGFGQSGKTPDCLENGVAVLHPVYRQGECKAFFKPADAAQTNMIILSLVGSRPKVE
jgi:hypothetical protein